MRKETKASVLKRLNRVGGQVAGIGRMVEADRYCIDIITQISAVQAALRRIEAEVLRDHVAHCVDAAIRNGSRDTQRKQIAELLDVFGRSTGR